MTLGLSRTVFLATGGDTGCQSAKRVWGGVYVFVGETEAESNDT